MVMDDHITSGIFMIEVFHELIWELSCHTLDYFHRKVNYELYLL